MAKLPKRQLYVEIEKLDRNGNREFLKTFENSLNVKFNFIKYIGNIMAGDGTVSLCGLDNKTIEALTSIGQYDTEIAKRRIIRVKAGYEGQELGLMINGTIKTAMPTVPPDIWLNCGVINNLEARENNNYAFATKEAMKLPDYIKSIADYLNLKIENRIKDENILSQIVSKQSISGNLFDIVYSISDAAEKITAYIENETLIIDYREEPPEGDERYSNPIEVNKDTGMVGLPEIFNAGIQANITTLLNTSIKTGNIINLTSSQIPAANGKYYVVGITYTGDYRGNAWYSMFHCRRAYNG